jgi:hypothetical protein
MGSGGSMEISSFFRLTLRRFVALLVVGVVAAALAGLVALRSAAKYQGSAVMFTAQVLKPGFPQYSLQPVSDNLQNMVFVGSVVDAASRASGEPAGQIASNLEAGPAGTDDIQVTYTSTNAKAVPVVLDSIAHGGLRELGRTQLKSAQSVVAQSQRDVNKTGTALFNYEQTHGTAASVQLLALQADETRALQALDDANSAVVDAQQVITRAALPSVVAVSGASKQSRLSDVARAAATAGVAAVALLLLVMFVSDWRRSREDELVREARLRSARYGPEGLLTDGVAPERAPAKAKSRRSAPDASRSA